MDVVLTYNVVSNAGGRRLTITKTTTTFPAYRRCSNVHRFIFQITGYYDKYLAFLSLHYHSVRSSGYYIIIFVICADICLYAE